MPYILHYHDDADNKPGTLDEEEAEILFLLQFKDDDITRKIRWKEVQNGERVHVNVGYLEKVEEA